MNKVIHYMLSAVLGYLDAHPEQVHQLVNKETDEMIKRLNDHATSANTPQTGDHKA